MDARNNNMFILVEIIGENYLGTLGNGMHLFFIRERILLYIYTLLSTKNIRLDNSYKAMLDRLLLAELRPKHN
jgi:hypothetical protein